MKDFLILRYFVSCPFVTDSVNVVYEKYYPREATRKNRHRDDPCNRILSAAQAKEIIERQRMIKVVDSLDGAIWSPSPWLKPRTSDKLF